MATVQDWGIRLEEREAAPFDPPSPAEILWRDVLTELRLQMGRATLNALLRGAELLRVEGDHYVIGVPSTTAIAWLEDRWHSSVRYMLANQIWRDVTLSFEPLDQ